MHVKQQLENPVEKRK